MQLSAQAQAILLLTVSLGKADTGAARPLTNAEWARFAIWLKQSGLEPAALLKADLDALLSNLADRSVTIDRVKLLLGRGAALGLNLEKWQRAGLWALTRSDPQYPDRLKRRLRSECPPVLFGCGNADLLNQGGLAVVGSRDANESVLQYTDRLGEKAASQGVTIVSGGARGVDQTAMLGALQNGGQAVGILADSLLRSAMSSQYRRSIMSGDLALITPFNPEAGFNVGNAMGRNRYIYCLADAAVVISSTADKGGTWAGALEDLKSAWVPLWALKSEMAGSGNSELVRRGAKWIPDDLKSLNDLFVKQDSTRDLLAQEFLFQAPNADDQANRPTEEAAAHPSESDWEAKPEDAFANAPTEKGQIVDPYTSFVRRLADLLSNGPMKPSDIATELEGKKTQVNGWLKRALEDGKIEKLAKPVRYRLVAAKPRQTSLFGEDL